MSWPPAPIRTESLTVRPPRAEDRTGFIELLCSDEVREYLGGPLLRGDVERDLPATPGNLPGIFAIEADGQFVGSVTLDRRDPERPGHLSEGGNEVEVSYTLLPAYWGRGYATEAVGGVLEWAERALPGEPVLLCTQLANAASMRLAARLGFVQQNRFSEFDAEQWLGVYRP
ncbi:GNAT family N-acetyltransferase [Nocardioides aurantiacus]|uniref:GNAT family N-acetyltransferase n=1 Tax=Nocardioides aurantiacus TaxID=86796 RepID=UPI003CCC591B